MVSPPSSWTHPRGPYRQQHSRLRVTLFERCTQCAIRTSCGIWQRCRRTRAVTRNKRFRDIGVAMTKPSEKVPVHFTIDDDSEAIALDRRTFVKGVGFAVLTVQCLSLIACASGKSPGYDNRAADNLIIHSRGGFPPHVHDLLIPYALLNAPPLQGVELTTTQAMLHSHKVVLTQKELITVNQRGTVTAKGGSHLFVITSAKRPDQIQA